MPFDTFQAAATAGGLLGFIILMSQIFNPFIAKTSNMTNTKNFNTDISSTKTPIAISTTNNPNPKTPNAISNMKNPTTETPNAISNMKNPTTENPIAIPTTKNPNTKTPNATSNMKNPTTETPNAISNMKNPTTETPIAISTTKNPNTKTPNATSNMKNPTTETPNAISNMKNPTTETPIAISTTKNPNPKTPNATSNTKNPNPKTPNAISTTNNPNQKTPNAISTTKNPTTESSGTKTFSGSHKGDVIVQLFEWRWKDIATECTFLPHYGYTAIQTSPVTENAILKDRPWLERYLPFSYKMTTRSGNEEDFRKMVQICNQNHIKVYVDVILNHMSSSLPKGTVGTAESQPDTQNKNYQDVPYGPTDFHKSCEIVDWNNPSQVRNCELNGRHDLNQASENVRGKIVDFLNKLIDIGVAGFRVSDAKHIAVEDLAVIYSRVKDLSRMYFPANSRPYIYQEVSDKPTSKAIRPSDYLEVGPVEDFIIGSELSQVFRRVEKEPLKILKTFNAGSDHLNWNKSVVFIDNQDYERSEALSYYKKYPNIYKMAVAYMLAWPHSVARIMSSYEFNLPKDGPPSGGTNNQISPVIRNPDGTCSGGWICEHRWREVYNMVHFRNTVFGSEVSDWWEKGKYQFAFCRKGKGFVAFNLDKEKPIFAKIKTCLPSGVYCDVISGSKTDKNSCSGGRVTVGTDQMAQIMLQPKGNGILAIHIGAKLD